jgi:hypothetical protein
MDSVADSMRSVRRIVAATICRLASLESTANGNWAA